MEALAVAIATAAVVAVGTLLDRRGLTVDEWNRKSFYQIRDYAWLDIDWRGI